jgi:hypothetical protein
MKLTGKNRSTRGETCPNATLSTTNPTWTEPGSNPGLRGERPATNCLSHSMAYSKELPAYLCLTSPMTNCRRVQTIVKLGSVSLTKSEF